jgi:molybdenum cofactor sulfurtransferase
MAQSTTQTERPVGVQEESVDAAYGAFCRAYPGYRHTLPLDDLRAREYSRLDAQGHVYLDYTGGGLYADSQVRDHMELLRSSVLGNPHSNNPTSQAMTRLIERARSYILDFFNASPDDYAVIFTANASAALKLVGEAYPFAPGDHYMLTADNHNSVNGIREFARAKGATHTYAPITLPEMRLDRAATTRLLHQARAGGNNLFAFPAQSNYSGVQHPLDMVAEAKECGWDVLVDCAAFAPTNRLDIDRWQPDFVPLSFYKIFGYPTGVGALIARRTALAKLRRPWFAGGTITIASVLADAHYLAPGVPGFEDGTVNYLNLPAVESGLRYISAVSLDMIHERVMCLTGWLLDSLRALRHRNGRPLVRLHGPWGLEARGGTISANYVDASGKLYNYRRIEELAGRANISLRTGCFCNPGAGEVAHGLTQPEMASLFVGKEPVSFLEMQDYMKACYGKTPSAIRVSLGLVSNFADVHRYLRFVRGFLDKTAEEIGMPEAPAEPHPSTRDSA